MKTVVSSALCLVVALFRAPTAEASASPLLWAKQLGTVIGNVATDASANVLVVGGFEFAVDFGGGPLNSAGLTDVFVAKYDTNGAHQWSRRFGSTGFDEALDVAVDGAGNVLVTGRFQGTVDFGGGGLASAGTNDIFLLKLDANGNFQWSKRFGSVATDYGYSVVTNGTGNVIVTGYFQNTVDFGGGGLTSAGSRDIFVAKFDTGGVHQWSKRFGGTGLDEGRSVDVDGAGNVAVTGFFNGSVDFGGGLVTSAGLTDIFLVKVDAAGLYQWSKHLGGTADDNGNGVAMDAAGDVVLTGSFKGSVDFGGGVLTSAGNEDIFLVRYNAASGHMWSNRFGDTSIDKGNSVAVDGTVVVLTGIFSYALDFGGSALYTNSPAGFLVKFNPVGIPTWSRSIDSIGFSDEGRCVAIDPQDHVVVGGHLGGTADLGGIALSGPVFLAKYHKDPTVPVIVAIDDVGNDQGKQVAIEFEPSGFDSPAATTPILQYEVFRRIDPAPALSAESFGGETDAPKADGGAQLNGWVFVGAAPAHGELIYNVIVPTLGDSTIAAGAYYSVFFIRAATASPFVYYDSPIDSGYSLDNLVPGVPSGLVYAAGVLSWDESTDADFDYFTAYGSSTATFDASAVVINYTTGTSMNVTGSPAAYYFVTATDFSGNEGTPAVATAPTDAGTTPPPGTLSVTAYPNPFNPFTTLEYMIPSRGRVTVAIYDMRGARVTTLVEHSLRAAGAYTEHWDGRSDAGERVASGVYFARVEHGSRLRSAKLVLVK